MPPASLRPLHNDPHRRDIDGLRAVAILSVLGYHANSDWLPGGFVGVDVFFVISGYLISGIIFRGLQRGTFSFADFYARRVKRIFPALLIVLVLVTIFGWFSLFTDEYQALGKQVAAGAAFVSNVTLWKEAGYFDPAAELKPLLHLWSLGIEEQFYLFWPPLFYFAWRRRINPMIAIIAITIGSFALNAYWIREHEVRTFYLPFTRIWNCRSEACWPTCKYGQKPTATFVGAPRRDARQVEWHFVPKRLGCARCAAASGGHWRYYEIPTVPGLVGRVAYIRVLLAHRCR